MNKKNYQKEKLPRPIVIANNKKQAEIKNILTLRDEMNKNNINTILVKKFIDEQYDKINKEYEERIIKYNKNHEKNPEIKISKEVKKKRGKAVEFLIKNKNFLEEHGASNEYIKKYVEKQYKEINEYYDNVKLTETVSMNKKINCKNSDFENIDFENVDFID